MSRERPDWETIERELVADLEALVIELADFSAYENSAHANPDTVAKIRAIRRASRKEADLRKARYTNSCMPFLEAF